MRKIKVIKKNPGEAATIGLIENDLKAFQDFVGGYVEEVKLCTNLSLLCNEEGLLKDLPYNTVVCGTAFYGPIILVGVKGYEFADLPKTFDTERVKDVIDLFGT